MDAIQAGSLVELLRIRAKEQAYQVAYSFLVDGEKQVSHISYAELDQQARAIAARLQSLNLQGSRAMLLFPQGLDYIAAFFGCLYAGVIAVPAYPPRNKRHLPRLQAIIANSQTSIILSTKTIEHTLDEVFGVDADNSLPILYTDMLSSDADDWYLPKLYPQDVAFLQYTSGSTGHAKGVMVTHANLMANQHLIKNSFGHDQNSTVVGWLPLYHDMGLIGNVMQPLFIGAPVILMSPMAFLEKPVRWLQAISEYRAHTSGGPNFAFDLCVQKISAAEKSQLDLSSWKLAFNGAEPIHAATLKRFSEAFSCCGFQREAFYPCYGLAESTLLATGGTKTAAPTVKAFNKKNLELRIACTETIGSEHTRELVGCGTVGINHQIRIVDPETQIICNNGHIGEIQVSGSSITQGYWQNSEETAHTFVPDLDDRVWLRTGDLGFIDNSELFVSGRLKDLIIIRGRNYYPHDIETAAKEAVDCISPGGLAAFSMTVDGNEILVLLVELKRSYLRQADFTTEFAEIRKRLVDDCGIQADTLVFIKPGAILKTTSGKIRRSDCKKAFENQQLDIIAVNKLSEETSANPPADYSSKSDDKQERTLRRQNLLLMPLATATKSLVNYLSDKIHRLSGLPKAQMDMSAPVLSMGIDSLKAMELKYFIDDFLAIDFPVALLLNDKSTIEIAEYALGLINIPSTETSLSANDAEKLSKQILSHGQQAIWMVCQLEPNTAVYNLPVALRINSEINSEMLRDSLRILINRHEQLRTGYRFDKSLPAPILLTQTEPVFSEITCHDEQDRTQRIISEIYHPFNLEQDHKLRTLLLSIGTDNYILLFCAHHIAADFRSLVILLTELKEIYSAQLTGQPFYLPALSAHYTDYSNWQINYLDSQAAKDAWHYWQQQLAGDLPKLQLPYDNTRPLKPSCRCGSETLTIDSKTTEKLHRLAEQYGVTLYMLLLTLFKVLLYRYSGQQDIIVGSPMLGRPKKDFTEVVGYFVNPVAIRSYPNWDKTFIDYLHEVKHTVLGALQYQDYPLSLLVEKLQPERGAGLSPFYDVCFVLQGDATADFDVAAAALGMPDVPLDWPGLNVKTVNLSENIAQFDINLMMAVTGKELSASFQYSRDLFEPSTIARMTGHFQTLLQGILDNLSQPLSALPLLTPPELHRQLIEWNATAAAYPHNTCVHQLFEQQVERSPEAIALVYQGQSLSYDPLNRKANRLAHHLIALGIRPGERVAICVERSLEMVIGLLGILKAGGAYVPLDPSYPEERLAFMLADCAPVAILTQQAFQKQLSAWNYGAAPIITLDAFSDQEHKAGLEQESVEHNPDPITIGLSNQHTAYVIYTSGSTGQPKGVMNAHQGVVNRLWWAQNEYHLDSSDRILQKTPFGFDVSVWEFFLPLLAGAHLIIAKPQGHQDPHYLAELIASAQITTLHFVPSMLQVFLDQADIQKCACLRRVLCSGEALPYAMQLRFHQLLSDVELHNLYGPTEAAIDVTSWLCSPDHHLGLVPIGRPIANTQIYILDAQLQPLPMGVSGEIHIGGIGVALGYLGRPELTAERFIDNPFQPNIHGQASARLYKTGDLGRWLPDGSIEYLGRNDFQVKIRGFRIELGEIEAQLSRCAGVREAVVIAREDVPGDKRLVAYLIAETEQELLAVDLRSQLSISLADYMLPSAFVTLDAFPLTPNGKLDRNALPAPDSSAVITRPYEAPQGETESVIAEIWKELLHLDQVGRYDQFFELGGHSLLAIQLMARLRHTFGIEPALRELFANPILNEFAGAISIQAHNPYSNLVTIRSSGNQRPLFLIHPAGGEIKYALDLAPWIDPDIPIYGLAATGFMQGETPLSAVEEMASRYIQYMRHIQPHGPYRIAGWSAGGTIAYEIANQLIGSDMNVDFVGLIDTACKYGSATEVNDIDILLSYMRSVAPPDIVEKLTVLSEINNLDAMINLCRDNGLYPKESDNESARNKINVCRSIIQSASDYSIYPISIPLTLFSASENTSSDNSLAWKALVGDNLKIIPLDGSHITIVESPYVENLGKSISNELNAIDFTSAPPEQDYKPLIMIQSGKSAVNPLFCVPGAGASITAFFELTQQLESCLPIYGLQPRGLDGHFVPHIDVSSAASAYLKSILEISPKEPYRLLGHSFGGWVVFEIALQLSAIGAEIETVIALDTEVPNFLHDSKKRYSHIEMLLELIKLFELNIDGKLGLTEADFLGLDQDVQLKLLLSRLTESKILPPRTKIQALHGIVRVFETNLNTHYVPSGIYQNALHLVKVPEESTGSVDDTNINTDYLNLWKRHAPKATLWEGPGNHLTLLSPPHVFKLAELLQPLLNAL